MGDGFTNNTLPAGTTGFNITTLRLYMVAVTAQTYTDVVARVQFWNTYASANTPVFAGAAGTTVSMPNFSRSRSAMTPPFSIV